MDFNCDLIIIAGGDGTVRKVIMKLLQRKVFVKPLPVAILPLGTANNITHSLGINHDPAEIINSLHNYKIKKYDLGRVYNVPEGKFFLEGFGFGILPYLMQIMHKQEKKEQADEELKTALDNLHHCLMSYQSKDCRIKADGKDYSGKYFMVEIMNANFIGPRLLLSPSGDPGDGRIEVVLLPESQRDLFANYIFNKMQGMETSYSFEKLKAKQISISWNGKSAHLDDEIIKMKKNKKIKIKINEAMIEFLLPQAENENSK